MRVFPRSLTNRLIVTAVGLVAVVGLLVAFVATFVMRGYLMDRLDDQLVESMSRAQHSIRGDGNFGPGDDAPPLAHLNRCGSTPPLAYGQSAGSITAVHNQSCRAGSTITIDGFQEDLSAAALTTLTEVSPGDAPYTLDIPGMGPFRVAATSTPAGDIVVQGLPTEPVDQTISSLLWWEISLALIGTAAAAAAALVMVRRQLRPLRQVAATAHEVTTLPLESGEVGKTARVPAELVNPETEVGQVADALNQLLRHVESAFTVRHESEQQLRQFLADASHELRTPLATIKGYAELSRRRGGTDPSVSRTAISKVEAEAARMSRLVEDMLLLARLDSGRPLETAPVDVTQLLLETVNDARVVDPQRKWRIKVPDEPVTINGDELRLHQAVTNLLTNASRHTPEGTVVTTTLSADPTTIVITDDGPGIEPQLIPTVFDRFTRGDSSRTRTSGGAGLGMSLVKAISEAHGGSVSVSSEPGHTEFVLKFEQQPETPPSN